MSEERWFYLKKQIIIAAYLNVGQIIVGYCLVWSAPIIPKLQDKIQTPLPEVVSLSEGAWVGSCYNLGSVIGSCFGAFLANAIGRKYSLMLGGILTLIASICLGMSRSFSLLIAMRIFSAIGPAIIAITNLVYIGEIALPSIRGILLTSTGVFQALGCLLVYSVAPFVSYRASVFIITGLSIIYLTGLLYIPESPLYYLIIRKEEKAIEILKSLGRKDEERKELQNFIPTHNEKWKVRELFTRRSNRKSLFITICLYVFQECGGILAISNFVTSIFQKASSSVDPVIGTIIIGVTQLIGTCSAPSFVERLGRKTLLLISTAGGGISMAILGGYFYLESCNSPVVNSLRWLPLLLLITTYCSYCIGLNIVPNTLIGEMFRPNMRSIGATISMNIGWFAGFLSVTSFGFIIEKLGSYIVFWIFTTVNTCAFIFVVLVVPETKGLSLREIDIMLAK